MSVWGRLSSVVRRRPFIAAAAALAVLVLLALVAAYGALQTTAGREALARLIERQLSTPDGVTVSIDGLGGRLPGRVRVGRIDIADPDGIWLTVRDVAIDWRPAAMLRGRLALDVLTAEEILVARRPAADATADTGPQGLSLPPFEILADMIAVSRIQLEEPVLGVPASLRLDASAAFADGDFRAALAAVRTDEFPGQADLAIAYDPETRAFDLDAAVTEPAGGLLARLLGLPGAPPVAIAINGDGPAEDWLGTLRAGAEGIATVESTVALALGDRSRVALRGTAGLGEKADARSQALFGPETAFDIELERPAGTAAVTLTVDRLESAALAVVGAVTLDPDDQGLSGQLQVAAVNGSRLGPLVAPVAFAAGELELQFEGDLSRPLVAVSARARQFSVSIFKAGEASLDFSAVRDERGDWRTTGQPARLATAGFVTGIRELDGPLGTSPVASATVAYGISDRRLEFSDLSIVGESATTDAELTIDLADIAVNADGAARFSELGPLASRLKRPVAGSGDVAYTVTWTGGDGLRIELDARLRDATLDAPVLEALAGSETRATARIAQTPDGSWTFDEVRVAGANFEVTGRAGIAAPQDTLDAEYAVSVTDLAPLGLARPAAGSGRLAVSGTARGNPGDPEVQGVAELIAGAAGGVAFDRLSLDYRIRDSVTGPTGKVSFVGAGPLAPDLTGRLDIAVRGDTIRIAALQASARGTTLAGEISVPLSGAAITGRLQTTAADLAPWSDFAGTAIGGRADLAIRLEAEMGQQAVALEATGTGISVGETLRASKLALNGRIAGPPAAPTVSLRGSAQTLDAGPARLKTVTLEVGGTLDDAAVAVTVAGEMRGPLSLDAAGRARRDDDGNTLTIARLSGQAAGAQIALTRPATIRYAPTIELKSLEMTVGKGRVEAEFSLSDQQVSLRAVAQDIPFVLLSPDAPPQLATTTVNAEATMNGPPGRPEGTIRVTAVGIAAGETAVASDGVNLAVDGRLRDGTLVVNGSIVGLDQVDTTLTATVPARFSMSPFSAELDRTRKASGQLTFVGPVGPAWALAGLDRHRLDGTADIRLGLSGTLAAPRIQGQARLSGARYENLASGTILSNLEVAATPTESAIVIDRAEAGDGNGGRITATGRVDFGGRDQLALDLTAGFEKARLVRRDELTAVASGSVRLTGTAADRLVAGRLEVHEAQIRIVGGLPSGVVTLDVVETGTMPDRPPPPPKPKPSRTRLDLDIAMPKRVFVRGRGLDSEWGGQLKVTGSVSEPRIDGELRPLRGQYDLAGLVFALQDGSVDFNGAQEVDPALDLSASRTTGDLTAIIRVTGTARSPEVKMESIPELPQDEVLSRLLFNKSTGRLSPAEALQLSNAVATLSGTGGSGLVGFARDMLSLDVLRFGDDDTGGGSATAGKYLNDRVYLGIEQGATAGSTSTTVEVEITPRLKIESDVGASEKSQVGIKWKRDY